LCISRVAINVYIQFPNYRKVRVEKGWAGEHLPRAGYKTICVPEDVYQSIKSKAKETNRTMPEYIKYLMETEKEKAEF